MTLTYDPMLPVELISYQLEEELVRLDVNEWPLLSLLRKESEVQKLIEFEVRPGGAVANKRLVGEAVTPQATGGVTTAKLEVGEHIIDHTFNVRQDQFIEAMRRGKAAINNLFVAKVREGVNAIMHELADLIYTGDGSAADAGIVGLDSVISAVSYGGISSVTYPNWIGYYNDNSANANAERLISRALIQNAKIAMAGKGGRATLFVSNLALQESVKALYQTLGSYSLGQFANLGVSTIQYEGLPFMADINAPAGKLYMINPNDMVLKFFDYSMSTMTNRPMLPVNVEGINFMIAEVSDPSKPELFSYNIKVAPQLVYYRRQAAGALADINDDPAAYYA